MSNYRIMRWDAVISSTNSNNYVPMIYIKPDKDFLQMIKRNKNVVKADISGTNMMYDLKPMGGIVSPSSLTPNCRPNYFDKTGYYVITLVSNWYGYPDPQYMGNVQFSGLPGDINAPKKEIKDNTKSSVSNDLETPRSKVVLPSSESGLKNPIVRNSLIAIGTIVLVFAIAFGVRKLTNKK
jgi:hypothetical protein